MASLLSQIYAAEPTTRQTIALENAPEQIITDILENEIIEERHALDSLISQSLGEASFPTGPSTSKSTLKGKENETSPLPFRLVSWTAPPRDISLLPRYHAGIHAQWPIEDSKEETRLRRTRAKQVAVDLDFITSGREYSARRVSRSNKVDTILASSSTDVSLLPTFFITERNLAPSFPLGLEGNDDSISSRIKCCPLIPVTVPSELENKKKRRRKRKSPPRERPQPSFFRPLQSWGGKSAGYAMGYRGSRPARWPGPYRYARDTMRKAIETQ